MRRGVEFDRIEAFVRAVDAPVPKEARLLPGDDAVPLQAPPGEMLVIGTDLSVEDIHFRRSWLTWEAIGYRATASALSDLAAMGARPLGVLISLALAPELDDRVYEELAHGIGELLRATGAGLLGGDLSGSPGPAVIDVVAVGVTASPLGRGGARSGDELWLTGSLGGASAAATAWASGLEPDPRARSAFERPAPRCSEILWLRNRAEIGAVIDLSDGLAGDADHMAAASGVRLELVTADLPLHPVLEEYDDRSAAVRIAVGGGEDYELLMATRPGVLGQLAVEFERVFDLRLTCVGKVEEGNGVMWSGSFGERALPESGFDHFAGR
jgi:thiamine-monophosphate kinase